jgi:predicted alpha/beta-fold hydrolase
VPGYVPHDVRDLYVVMQKTVTLLRERHDVQPTAIHFLGFSLGALEGAYLTALDAEEGKLGIAKYLLINPPVDLDYAVDKIDDWVGLVKKFGPDKAQALIAAALGIVDSFADDKLKDPTIFDRFVKQFSRFSTEELQFLIAQNLQSQLNELVAVTQVIHDQGLLSAPKNDIRRRLEEARRFTLTDYHEKIAVPIWRKYAGGSQATRRSFQQESALLRITDRLRANPKVHIMHNADDFLVQEKSLEALKEALGSQITVYPYGGHLGNLWYSENKQFVLNYFAGRAITAAR